MRASAVSKVLIAETPRVSSCANAALTIENDKIATQKTAM
jgi:hypothetical protein